MSTKWMPRADLAALVADLTATDPAERPASAAQVAARAGELLAVPLRASAPLEVDHGMASLSHSSPENLAHADWRVSSCRQPGD